MFFAVVTILLLQVSTPEITQESSQNSVIPSSLSLDETLPQEPRNPFSKKEQKTSDTSNPLSLINKYAGVDYVDAKENRKINENEKRKQPDSETEKPREKQRKLDKFMFSKRT